MNVNRQFHVYSFSWPEISSVVLPIVPPLSHGDQKGSMGRIAVIGGSSDYTGAPFYAADAALKFGADLSTVFCAQSAAVPIKSYSPELMVTPFYNDESLKFFSINETIQDSCSARESFSESEESMRNQQSISKAVGVIEKVLPRIHTLVIGPGLGRDALVAKAVVEVIALARKHNILLVIDADGLWILNEHHEAIHGYARCVITPNAAEYIRLTDSLRVDCQRKLNASSADLRAQTAHYEGLLNELSSADDTVVTRALSLALGGVTVLRKGENDIISAGNDVFVLTEKGSPRRCGGQGDILAGCLAVALHWQHIRGEEVAQCDFASVLQGETRETTIDLQETSDIEKDVDADVRLLLTKSTVRFGVARTGLSATPRLTLTAAGRQRLGTVCAAVLSATTVKHASRLAFETKKRAMTAPDVLAQVGEAFDHLTR